MTNQFTYTDEEILHLEMAVRCIFEEQMFGNQYDAEYFREEARSLEANPFQYCGDYPSPDDVFNPTSASMNEQVDMIECGAMVFGEELP